jgi:hypothetical protein
MSDTGSYFWHALPHVATLLFLCCGCNNGGLRIAPLEARLFYRAKLTAEMKIFGTETAIYARALFLLEMWLLY